jgi:multidrug efflux pump subunit AcrA (membrane-fusion protein)
MTCRAVRRAQREFRNTPNSPLLDKIFRANERLAAQHSIDQHVVRGLTTALQDEKKRRKRGKRLNLLEEEDSGPQLFSPARIQTAREHQAIKEQAEQQRQQDIIDRKALAATRRQQKEDKKAQRAIIMAQKRQLAAELRAQKAAEKQAQKELKEATIQQHMENPGPKQQSTMPTKAQKTHKKQIKSSGCTTMVSQSEETILATSRGRRVQLPQRFII